MKILISWEAFKNDYKEDKSKAPLNTGPTISFHQHFYESEKYDRHILLSTAGNEKDQKRCQKLVLAIKSLFEKHAVEVKYVQIVDVIDVNEIRRKINKLLHELKEHEIHVFISPGTPAMQTAWYLSHLELADVNTTLIQTRAGKFTSDGKPELIKVAIEKSQVPFALVSKQENQQREIYAGKSRILKTKSLERLYDLAAKVAQTDNINVLITGPSGSGKENVAHYIHDESVRKGKKIISLNCSALNDQLLSSQLFGYKKGAFTGADHNQNGLFLEADGGTIFLDEIGDISPFMQQSLLRVLQSGEILPLGSNAPVTVDVRVIAATHKDLRSMCASGGFRWDLYYRLTTAALKVPSLMERGDEEVEEYLNYFITILQQELQKPAPLKLSKTVKQFLIDYTYPGNLREMRNLLSTLYVFYDNQEVNDFEFLPEPNTIEQSDSLDFEEAIFHIKKKHIIKVLKKTNGNISKSADLIGWAQNTLRKEMAAVGVEIEDFRR